MSRSRRKTKIFGHTGCPSEKEDKQLANRALRRISKIEIDSIDDFDNLIVPDINEVSSLWNFGKDGKSWWGKATEKDMRK